MKRRCIAFTLMLCAVMLIKLGLPVFAEMTGKTDDRYEAALTYMEGREGSVAATITPPMTITEAMKTLEKEFSFSTNYGNSGEIARASVQMVAVDREMTEDEWQQVSDFLARTLGAAVPSTDGLDAEAMARKMLDAVEIARAKTVPGEDGLPVYAQDALHLSSLSVAAPYYPELQRGARGDEVKALQERMIVLGYLDGAADGQFGKGTASAVEQVETELRAREQQAIEASATPVPTPAPEPTPLINEAGEAVPVEAAPTPEPIPAPEPATKVDGVADLAFQIRLYSDELPLIAGTLDKGANASAVTRLQRRLLALGTLTGAADGDYGANTRRGVRIFQHYNGLAETGIADEAVQKLIFSTAAKAPENPLMTTGSSGSAVKQLQKRLIELGFMKATVADGDYGNATKVGIENLQTYMREKEIAALTAEARAAQNAAIVPAQPDVTETPEDLDDSEDSEDRADSADAAALSQITVTPTIPVNGIADPLLLDAFYASDFETIPSPKKNGDTGLDVMRIQRRLAALEYLYAGQNGSYGDATESAVRAFQERNKLSTDGIAGRSTMETLFSSEARKALKPYMLKVSTSKQRVYAYAPDENEEYTRLVRTMKCSTGLNDTPTPKGTYIGTTGPGARWHYFKKFTCWAQYAYYIEGDYMFHSVLYSNKGGSPTGSSVRNLGSKASHGCVRLAVEDAKWIYQNCPPNTKIVVT
ncbi:MAG: L,D-transpeptidase family protein [Clostridia bacterium]